jgi:hypothetical protein
MRAFLGFVAAGFLFGIQCYIMALAMVVTHTAETSALWAVPMVALATAGGLLVYRVRDL